MGMQNFCSWSTSATGARSYQLKHQRDLRYAQLKTLRVSLVLRTNPLQLKYLLKSLNLIKELLEQSRS